MGSRRVVVIYGEGQIEFYPVDACGFMIRTHY